MRSLRSFGELAAIEVARELFYTEDGRPNELWHRFTNSVSLYNFARPNLNGARPDVLTAIGQFEQSQQQNVADYLTGAGMYRTQGPAWFTDVAAARAIAGPSGNASGFSATISALRVFITVREGQTEFKLSAVVAPPRGASTVDTTATSSRSQASASANQATSSQPQPSGNATASADPRAASNAKKLNYPFTLLEIRENDEIPPPPPPPPATPT